MVVVAWPVTPAWARVTSGKKKRERRNFNEAEDYSRSQNNPTARGCQVE
jgi:hypothetical protein